MNRKKISSINNYLSELPDNYFRQVVNFIGYLNYSRNFNSDYPFPDEREAIAKYNSGKMKTVHWDSIKNKI